MTLSVIVPAFNEQETIGELLDRLLKVKQVDQVVVVSDASDDDTDEIVSGKKSSKLLLVRHEINLGKGAAIRTGLDKVDGDYVMVQDADLEYDPGDIPVMLEPVLSERAEVVYGSRFFGPHTNMFYWHYLGNKFLNFLVNVLYDSILSDMETCYKLIPTDLLKSLDIRENDFRIEPEITCKLLKRNIKIMEVPISYVGRTYDEGKKISWVDGFLAVATILRIRFGGG